MSVYFVEYKQGLVSWTSKWRMLRLGKQGIEFASRTAAQRFAEALQDARGVAAVRVLTPDPQTPWAKLEVIWEDTAGS